MTDFLPKDLPETLRGHKFGPKLLTWYRSNNRQLPWRLDFQSANSPYPVLVSEIMLQQTVIEAVLPAYARFMRMFPSVQDLASATSDDVRQACKGLGYYRRFGFLHATAKQIAQADAWPDDFESWRTLPGIGEYTASALSSIVNSRSVMVVDGNVERVFCRLLDLRVPSNTPSLKRELQKIGPQLVDRKRPGDFNQALMELGQLVCRPLNPTCDKCPVSHACLAKARDSQKLAPQPKLRTKPVEVNLGILMGSEGESKLSIEKRSPQAKFLAGITGFRIVIQQKNGHWIADGSSVKVNLGTKKWLLMGSFRHTITNHKLTVQVFAPRTLLNSLDVSKKQKLHGYHEIQDKLVASLDQKALNLLLKKEPTNEL